MTRLIQTLAFSVMLAFGLSAGSAKASPDSDRLLALLGAGELLEIMREEGLGYADDLAAEMLGSGASVTWERNIAKIYNLKAMTALTQGGFAKALEGQDLAPMLAFFESSEGARIVQLEVTARRAMLDADIEDGAIARGKALRGTDAPRVLLTQKLIETGDMLEANVVSALNSNILFYQGLVDGGAFELSEQEIITDVWSQEAQTRAETEDWLYGFFLMAYDPLPEQSIAEFVDFTDTGVGRALTRAIFAAYDGMYADISYALGRAVAREMQAEDI